MLALGAPRRHKLLALLSFLSIVMVAVVALKVLPKRYLAEGSLLVRRTSMMESLFNPNLNRGADTPTHSARNLVLRRENLITLCQQVDCVKRHVASRAPAARLLDGLRATLTRHQPSDAEMLD